MSVWKWLLKFWQPRRKFPVFWKDHQKLTQNSKKILSLKFSWQKFFSLNSVFWTNWMQFLQRCSSVFAKLLKNLSAQIQKRPVIFLRIFSLSLFSWTCNLIFWQHWRVFTAENFKFFCSIPIVFEKSNTIELKCAKSTSDRQTNSSDKSAKFSGQKSKKKYSKSKRKVTATKFSTESIFPQVVSWETSKVAWLRCWSFSVKLLNFFRFKSEKYAKLEVFQKKVPNCFSQKRRIQFWQLCGSAFAKTARRSHSK